jgi:hypothetical protein
MSIQKIPKSSNTTGYGFVLGKPDSYDPTKRYPLIIFLHGIVGSGDGSDTSLDRLVNGEIPKVLQTNALNHGFLLLAPQISGTNYTGNETDAMINYAISNLAVDPNKIHLTGLSLGGGGTLNYISSSATRAAKLATAIPIATTYITGNYKYVADANLPVWAFHNLNDTNGGTPVAATNYAVTAINSYGGFQAVKTLFNTTGHGGWGEAYGDAPPVAPNGQGLVSPTVNIYQWMLMNTKDSPVAVPGTSNNGSLVANAGADFMTVLQKVSLNGGNSQNFSSASWSIVSTPPGIPADSAAIFPSGSGWYVIDAFLPKEGTYVFRLTVKDRSGNSATDDVSVIFASPGGISTTTTTTTTNTVKTELSRTWIAKLGKFVYVYDDGTTEIK